MSASPNFKASSVFDAERRNNGPRQLIDCLPPELLALVTVARLQPDIRRSLRDGDDDE
jgi:hypothetical protein